jgi:hypothetical protein
MRENVMVELKQMQPEDESKKKMLDILKRLHLEEEMASDGEDGMFCVLHVPMPLIYLTFFNNNTRGAHNFIFLYCDNC